MTVPAKADLPSVMDSVITKGDLSQLTPDERVRYYGEVCKSVGLNPLTKPFEYITLNNKLMLYALRNCTDQLRTIHGVSVDELAESERDGIFIVTAKVRNKHGRTDMAKGAVAIANLRGDVLANAMMRAETKAKRRATLSICGLGFVPDETEVDDIPINHRGPPTPAPNVMLQPHDPDTGEVLSPAPNNAAVERVAAPDDASGAAALSIEDMAREAALRGEEVFNKFYKSRSREERNRLKDIGDELRGLMP